MQDLQQAQLHLVHLVHQVQVPRAHQAHHQHIPVSYTHLDVYKRQVPNFPQMVNFVLNVLTDLFNGMEDVKKLVMTVKHGT